MNFVCDEGVDRSIVGRLRSDGHDVVYIAELAPSIPDEEVLGEANQRGAVLVTADKDFGELVFRLRMLTTGVLLLRLGDLATEDRATLVGDIVGKHAEELPGSFSVLTSSKFRIRKPL